ncbi:MAG: redoxin family protein [Hyphomonadaceae bacterium]
MKRWLAVIPLVLLAGLAVLGASRLYGGGSGGVVGQVRVAPGFVFERLGAGEPLVFNPPPEGEVIIVNLFASWCGPCEAEHPMLLALSEIAPTRLYGVLYKDSEENGRAFLTELGDPFTAVGMDPDGQGALDFGLTGVPETYVVDADGRILLHVTEALTPADVSRIRELVN